MLHTRFDREGLSRKGQELVTHTTRNNPNCPYPVVFLNVTLCNILCNDNRGSDVTTMQAYIFCAQVFGNWNCNMTPSPVELAILFNTLATRCQFRFTTHNFSRNKSEMHTPSTRHSATLQTTTHTQTTHLLAGAGDLIVLDEHGRRDRIVGVDDRHNVQANQLG